MDFVNAVYNAARDGKIRRLKVFLDHRSADEVQSLVGAKTNGATPLVMACKNGHYNVVEYLVDNCKAKFEQSGSVIFDSDTIEGAPPLWCAAAAGHIAIVKFLVKRGAKVNATTKTNSTPLRAACFDGHFEIAKFLVEHGADIEVSNRHGHTCLMIACYKGHYQIAKYLISLGAKVNKKSVKGNTALHDCAESGSLEIMKILLDRGAKMDFDSYGMTPLLAASVTGHTHIVEFLLQEPHLICRRESIDALELLGSTYVDKKREMIGALDLWRRAMAIRYTPGLPDIVKPPQSQTIEAYENTTEFRVAEEIDDLLADPDEMKMQALIIRERILGPAHPDTSYYIRHRGAVYADAGKFARCISLWTYALDMQQSCLEPLNPMTQSSLFSFTELFSFMMGEEGVCSSGRGILVPYTKYCDIAAIVRKAIREVMNGMSSLDITSNERDAAHLHRVLVITLQLICLLIKTLKPLTPVQKILAHQMLYTLVCINVRGRNGQTLLHLACSPEAALVERYSACRFPSIHLVETLLKLGVDVNARDDFGNTPLHVAAISPFCPPALVHTLLAYGAHLDTVNNDGKTFKDSLQQQELHQIVNPVRFTKLSCLAAQVIRRNKIEFRGEIPLHLEEFVMQH